MHVRVFLVLLSQLICPSAVASIPTKTTASLRGSDISESDSDAPRPTSRRLSSSAGLEFDDNGNLVLKNGQVKGLCRYGENEFTVVQPSRRSESYKKCRENCLTFRQCTAFAYDWKRKEQNNCMTYGGQVYEFGSNRENTVCENVPACWLISKKELCMERKSVCKWDDVEEQCSDDMEDYLFAIAVPLGTLGVFVCIVMICFIRRRAKDKLEADYVSARFPKGNNLGRLHEKENREDMKEFHSKVFKSDAKELNEIIAYKKRREQVGYGKVVEVDSDALSKTQKEKKVATASSKRGNSAGSSSKSKKDSGKRSSNHRERERGKSKSSRKR